MPDRNAFVSNSFARRQLYFERAKTALHREYGTVTGNLVRTLTRELSRRQLANLGVYTKGQLRALIRNVLEQFDKESGKFFDDVMEWLGIAVEDEATFTVATMDLALGREDTTVPTAGSDLSSGIIAATGLGAVATLRDFNRTQRNTVRKHIQRAWANKLSVQDTIRMVQGTRSRRFRDGLVARMQRFAEATVSTVAQFGESVGRSSGMQPFLDVVIGYTWVSILDGKTSTICRSLSGRVFRFGQGPIPPVHLNCRSHIEPIFRSNTVFARTGGQVIAAGETYYSWLRRQTRQFQDDVLGPTRGDLFRNGGLTSDQFSRLNLNRQFEPLTLDEMRARQPEAFREANV